MAPLSTAGGYHKYQHAGNPTKANEISSPHRSCRTRTRKTTGNVASRRGSRGGPPPPLPSRPPSTASGSRSPVPGGAGAGAPAKRDDRGALLALLYQCSPPPPPGANPSAIGGWKIATGWAAATTLNRWYGVSTRHEDRTKAGSERVTGLMLPKNELCGKTGGRRTTAPPRLGWVGLAGARFVSCVCMCVVFFCFLRLGASVVYVLSPLASFFGMFILVLAVVGRGASEHCLRVGASSPGVCGGGDSQRGIA